MLGTTTVIMRGGMMGRPAVACGKCKLARDVDDATFEMYFQGKPILCAECNGPIALWDATVRLLLEMPRLGNALVLAGAKMSWPMGIKVRAHEWTDVDLTQHGMPADAELLAIHLGPMGGPFPMMMLGHEPLNTKVGPKFRVYGATGLFPGERDDEGSFTILAVWHVFNKSDTSLRHLVEAAREYNDARYDDVVVPANIAAEVALTPLVVQALEPFASTKSRFEQFLREGATNAHNLNVLLAVAAHLKGTPRLPEEVRAVLQGLNTCRNEVMHRGTVLNHSQRQAAENLAAAIFAVRYSGFDWSTKSNPTK